MTHVLRARRLLTEEDGSMTISCVLLTVSSQQSNRFQRA